MPSACGLIQQLPRYSCHKVSQWWRGHIISHCTMAFTCMTFTTAQPHLMGNMGQHDLTVEYCIGYLTLPKCADDPFFQFSMGQFHTQKFVLGTWDLQVRFVSVGTVKKVIQSHQYLLLALLLSLQFTHSLLDKSFIISIKSKKTNNALFLFAF